MNVVAVRGKRRMRQFVRVPAWIHGKNPCFVPPIWLDENGAYTGKTNPILKNSDYELFLVLDDAGKPVGINSFIGRRPIAAFGNSDGDFAMLEWVTAGPGLRLGLLVHHDDPLRESAYDRGSPVGKLERGLDEAPHRGWAVVSMKNDWNRVFP